MKEICTTVLFTRDLKRIAKRNKNLDKIKSLLREKHFYPNQELKSGITPKR